MTPSRKGSLKKYPKVKFITKHGITLFLKDTNKQNKKVRCVTELGMTPSSKG